MSADTPTAWARLKARARASLLHRLGASTGPRPTPRPLHGYMSWLADELHAYIAASYPDTALSRDRFRDGLGRYADPAWLRATNRYVGDLWYLFEPDFAGRLDDYYRQQDLQLTMSLFSYAGNDTLLEENYLRPYREARAHFGRAAILEVGAGLPHGLLHLVWSGDTAFCGSLVTVDIPGTPARFVEWFCRERGIPHTWVRAVAGAPTRLEGLPPADFVFAKDVFEHLLDPVPTLDAILGCVAPRALLALDLDDKGAVEYQHVSPVLAPLGARVEAAGFARTGQTGNVTLFGRQLAP